MATVDWTKTYFKRHPILIASSLNALGIEAYNREVALDYLAFSDGEVTPDNAPSSNPSSPSPLPPQPRSVATPSPHPTSIAPEFIFEGDTVRVLEAHQPKYADLVEASSLGSLVVRKKIPGKGGGLIVETVKKNRLKVAQCHVEKIHA